MQIQRIIRGSVLFFIFTSLACNLPVGVVNPSPPESTLAPVGEGPAVQTSAPPTQEPPTSTPQVVHVAVPGNPPGSIKLVYDVVSEDTAPERRAPYGDSYDINRLERPFTADMTYLPYLDIWTYTVDSDTDWWYVSIRLVGQLDQAELPLQYGVELDINHDGFGDYAIVGTAPFPEAWDTAPVRIYEDKNRNTGGLSAEKSDAPLTADGYETIIFNGGPGDADPDRAWVRSVPSSQPTVQFAFKKSWSGTVFMLGAFADAGLQDPGKLDYVDRFTIAQAGSPVRSNSNYPLKELFAVDNVCREAFGFKAGGYEPQLCPREEPAQPRAKPTAPSTCQDPGNCPYGWSGEPYCYCTPG